MSAGVEAHRPGVRSMLVLVGCEARMVARDTSGLLVPLCLPLLIMLSSASAASAEQVGDGRTALDVYVLPLVLSMVVALIGIVNMPSFLAYYRCTGILRRLAVTPVPPLLVLAAQAIVSVLQAVLGIGLAVTVALLAFGANPPADPAGAVGVVALAIAAMYGIGMIVAAVSPTPNAAVAIALVVFFVLGSLGGMFGGRDALPEPVAELGGWLPFGTTVQSLSAAWAGSGVDPAQLLVLAGTAVLGAVVAAALFRWE